MRPVLVVCLLIGAGCLEHSDRAVGPSTPDETPLQDTAPLFGTPQLANRDGNAYEPGIKIAPDGSLWLHAHKANAVAEGTFLASWLWWSGDNGTTWASVNSPAGLRDALHSFEGDVAFDEAGQAWFFEHAHPGGRITSWSLTPDGPVWKATLPVTIKASYDDRPWLEAYGDGRLYLLSKTLTNVDAQSAQAAPYVLRASDDGGVTWRDVKAFVGSNWCDLGSTPDGQSLAVGCDVGFLPNSRYEAKVWRSDDGGATWTETVLAQLEAEPANQFVSTAMDSDGNAFHVWIDDALGDDIAGKVMVARHARGGPWEILQPSLFNGSFQRGWVSAVGGRVVVSFSAMGNSQTEGGWYPYLLLSDTATAPNPTWHLVRLDDTPQSTGPSSPGDFWQNAVGPDARVHACWGRVAPTPVALNINYRNDLYCAHEKVR